MSASLAAVRLEGLIDTGLLRTEVSFVSYEALSYWCMRP
jgi:hypothetical protein